MVGAKKRLPDYHIDDATDKYIHTNNNGDDAGGLAFPVGSAISS
jgi:hypothetical protein